MLDLSSNNENMQGNLSIFNSLAKFLHFHKRSVGCDQQFLDKLASLVSAFGHKVFDLRFSVTFDKILLQLALGATGISALEKFMMSFSKTATDWAANVLLVVRSSMIFFSAD